MSEPMPPHAIAIVGMAGRFPDAETLEAFWRNMSAGTESLVEFSDAELDAAGVPPALRAQPNYVRRGTVLAAADFFDAAFFGLSPREAQVIDPQQRIFLECAWEALEHSGYAPGALPESVGVYAGASMNSYVYTQLLRNPALAEAVGGYQVMLGNDKDFLCTRVSYKLGLRGPSMTIQTACSTSLVAVQVACRALQRGECDMALAGGVSTSFPQRAGYLYQDGMIFSPDGHCRPFDVRAQGTRAGAGAGIVVLKRLSEAVADGDTVHAVIRGIAVNNDGSGKAGYTAPSVEGQAEVIATAQALAGVSPRSISYVEAHGTATPLGDPIEIAALTQAFRAGTAETGFCRLGSLKANLGHLDAAAGVAGLIKTVLALQHRTLPPLVNFSAPNPALELARSPFVASGEGAEWRVQGGMPRRAGVSSFGIGGTNAHAVLEEAPPQMPLPETGEPQVLLLSARSETALDAATQRLADHLRSHPGQSLADMAWTLQAGRVAFAHRRAVVARDHAQALAMLREPHRAPALSGHHEGSERPVAFLFSGQGSQHAAMGRDLYAHEAAYRDAVDRCAALLRPLLDGDIRDLLHADGGDATLAQTRFTQPALFVNEYALATLWQHWGVQPAAMIGHSLGEYVAAHLAGVMSLADALAIVVARGRLMQQQAPGRMAVVHLGPDDLRPWLAGDRAAGSALEIAAINAPGLVTVSGPADAIAGLVGRLANAGIEARELHTSHAFHSSMMDPALAPLQRLLEGIALAPPQLRYVSNLTGTWITPEQATSPAYYAEHLRRTVLFEAGLRTLAADPALFLLEVGPAQVLATLARLSLDSEGARRVASSMRRPTDARADTEAMREAAARLWLAGVPVQWSQVHGQPRRRVPLPTYPFERRRHAIDPAADSVVPATKPAAQATGATRRSARIDDWFYAPTWARDDVQPQAPAAGRWLVLGDCGALAQAVCAELRERGLEPVLLEAGECLERIAEAHWRVRPGRKEDVKAVIAATGASGLRGAVHLWSLPGNVPAALGGVHSYHALVALAAALPVESAPAPLRLLHVSAGAESVLGEAVHDWTAALTTGPVLALPTELPGLLVRRVDLEAQEGRLEAAGTARQITAELGIADQEPLVARRAGCRWVRRYERLALPAATAQALPFKPRGCYLITGGLGGMGLELARWLGHAFGARLVLTSRSGLPPRERWDACLNEAAPDARQAAVAAAITAIRTIEAGGGQVLAAAADAVDEGTMAEALAAARRRFGGIDGVIHAAGVSGRGGIALRTPPAEAACVFAPKAEGLAVLLRLLGSQPLDVVALMGSISAVTGTPGACDYGAANAVLDAFVDSAARPAGWKRVVSVDWGAWRDVGMAAKLQVADTVRALWQRHLDGAIPSAAGIDAFGRVLASGRRRVVVDTYDLVQVQARLRQPEEPGAAGAPSAPSDRAAESPDGAARPQDAAARQTAAPRPALSSRYVAPGSDVERRLAAIWQELLGVEGIGAHDDFFELGGHSLMATRVLARIGEAFAVRLALRDIFDTPTVAGLAARVAASAPAATTAAAGDEEREELEF